MVQAESSSRLKMSTAWTSTVLLIVICSGKIASQELIGSAGLQTMSTNDQRQLSINLPQPLVERLLNSTSPQTSDSQETNVVWLLLAPGSNLTALQDPESGEFGLFKLNYDSLIGGASGGPSDPNESEPMEPDQDRYVSQPMAGAGRQARKFHFFKNVLNKPKVSPLYLVNGTVCRFVNSQPICTTLSTTGLLRGPQPALQNQQNGQQSSGFFQNQFGQQQNANNNNLQPNQRQVNVPTNQVTNQNLQPFRPAALMDDESADLSVESTLNSTLGPVDSQVSGSASGGRVVQQRPVGAVATVGGNLYSPRPGAVVVSRRPLNLLQFGRPFRPFQANQNRNLVRVQANGWLPRQ